MEQNDTFTWVLHVFIHEHPRRSFDEQGMTICIIKNDQVFMTPEDSQLFKDISVNKSIFEWVL